MVRIIHFIRGISFDLGSGGTRWQGSSPFQFAWFFNSCSEMWWNNFGSEVSWWCRSICLHINFYSAAESCTLLLDWDFSSRHLKWNTCSSPFDDLFKTIAIGRPESRACNNVYCVKQLLYIALNCLLFRVIYTSWHTITIVSFWSVLMQCWQPAEMQKNLEADILPGSISFIWRFLYMDQTTKLLQFYFKQTLQAKQWRSYVKQ